MNCRRWFFEAVWALLCAAPVIASADDPTPPNAKPATVSVAIDYGDGVQKHFTALPWKKGMTVQTAMELAQSHPRGIRFEHIGTRATALLTKIDNLANEGGGRRNWIYRVNGKPATKSFGVYDLAPGDSVLWSFEPAR